MIQHAVLYIEATLARATRMDQEKSHLVHLHPSKQSIISLAKLLLSILIILIIQQPPPQILNRRGPTPKIPRRPLARLAVELRRRSRRTIRERIRLLILRRQVPRADVDVAQAERRRAAGTGVEDGVLALRGVGGLGAGVGAAEEQSARRVLVEEVLHVAVEIPELVLRVRESVGYVGGGVPPECRTFAVLAVAVTAAW